MAVNTNEVTATCGESASTVTVTASLAVWPAQSLTVAWSTCWPSPAGVQVAVQVASAAASWSQVWDRMGALSAVTVKACSEERMATAWPPTETGARVSSKAGAPEIETQRSSAAWTSWSMARGVKPYRPDRFAKPVRSLCSRSTNRAAASEMAKRLKSFLPAPATVAPAVVVDEQLPAVSHAAAVVEAACGFSTRSP